MHFDCMIENGRDGGSGIVHFTFDGVTLTQEGQNHNEAIREPFVLFREINLETLSQPVQINETGRVRCEPGWRLGADWSARLRDFDLWFCWAGKGRMLLEDGEMPLFPGACVWMRPGRRYEAAQDPQARLGVNFIHFELLGAANESLSAVLSPPERLTTRDVEFVDQLQQRIINLSHEPGGAHAAGLLLKGLLAALVTEQQRGGRLTGTELHHHELMHRIAARMRENPSAISSLAELAREGGYSADHFSAVFAQVVGMRPQAYLIKVRLERAKQLLAETDLPIGQIADAVGIESPFFFSRQFRAKTGMTPSAYRRRLRPAEWA
jgi:AraC-like DNA-binding protein